MVNLYIAKSFENKIVLGIFVRGYGIRDITLYCNPQVILYYITIIHDS